MLTDRRMSSWDFLTFRGMAFGLLMLCVVFLSKLRKCARRLASVSLPSSRVNPSRTMVAAALVRPTVTRTPRI